MQPIQIQIQIQTQMKIPIKMIWWNWPPTNHKTKFYGTVARYCKDMGSVTLMAVDVSIEGSRADNVFYECSSNWCAQENILSHWLHLFNFSLQCVFKCIPKLPTSVDAKSHYLHLFDFSQLCVFKCLLKLPASYDA